MSKAELLNSFSEDESAAIAALVKRGIVVHAFRITEPGEEPFSCHLHPEPNVDAIARHGGTLLEAIEAARQVAEIRWPEKFEGRG